MLLVFTGTLQRIVDSLELLMRRIIQIIIPVQQSEVEKFPDTSALSVCAAACLHVTTIPVQAVISLITALNRHFILMFTALVLFIVLFV